MVVHEEEAVRKRMEIAFDLYETAEQMIRQKLRREHPNATPEQIEQGVLVWLKTRPGVEHGDAEGRPVSRPIS